MESRASREDTDEDGEDAFSKKIPLGKTAFGRLTRDAMIQLLIRMDRKTIALKYINIKGISEILQSKDFYIQKLKYLTEGRNIPEKELIDIFNLFPGDFGSQHRYEQVVRYFILPTEGVKLSSWESVYVNIPFTPSKDDFPHLWMIAVERDSRRALISLLKSNLYFPAVYFFYLKYGEGETRELLLKIPFSLPYDENFHQPKDPLAKYNNNLLQRILEDDALLLSIRTRRDDEILQAFKGRDYSITVNMDSKEYMKLLTRFLVKNGKEEINKKIETSDEEGSSSDEEADRKEIIIKSLLHLEVTDGELNELAISDSTEGIYRKYFVMRDNRIEIIDKIQDISSLFSWAVSTWESTTYLVNSLRDGESFREACKSTSLGVCDMIITRARKVSSHDDFMGLIDNLPQQVKPLFLARLSEEEKKEYKERSRAAALLSQGSKKSTRPPNPRGKKMPK